MNGLQYENLPAQQDPVDILRKRYHDNQRQLQSQYKSELDALRTKRLPKEQLKAQVDKVNYKYTDFINKERNKINQQTQQLKRIQSLIDSGNIAPDAGNEAMWRMVLPQETERAMFPTEKKEAAQPKPYSMTQLTSMEQSMIDFVERAPDTPGLEWGPPKKTKQGLIDQYNNLRRLTGYSEQGYMRQDQFDFQWDALMRGDKRFDAWWSGKEKRKPAVEVQMQRSKGAIGKMMNGRINGTPAVSQGNVTPMGRSIERKKPTAFPTMFGPAPIQRKSEPAETVPEQMLSRDMALEILRQAGGNREKARQIAKQKGYKF